MKLTHCAPSKVGPLVTAVLVCWNHERYVREAVLSALAQNHAPMELLVFDNGSSDGSRRELKALQADFSFTLICQENVGLVRTLNRALERAEGKYLAILATDDAWLPDKTTKQVAFLESYPDVDVCSGQTRGVDSEGNPAARNPLERPGDATFVDLMSLGCFVYGPTMMCRVDTLRQVGGFDEELRIEDYSLALQMTAAGRRVHVLADDLTLYRRHEASWSAGGLYPDLLAIGARYRHTPEYRAFYRRHFPLRFWSLVKDGRKREAWRIFLSEPEVRSWNNLGRGWIRMLIPYALVNFYRRVRRPT